MFTLFRFCVVFTYVLSYGFTETKIVIRIIIDVWKHVFTALSLLGEGEDYQALTYGWFGDFVHRSFYM